MQGFSVAAPFEERVIAMLDEVVDSAKETGAVTAVVSAHGKLVGHNTDWIGAQSALSSQQRMRPQMAVTWRTYSCLVWAVLAVL